MKFVFILVSSLLLLSCDSVETTKDCSVTGENYLKNSDFVEKTRSGGARHWAGIQHAGEKSFVTTIDGDVITIDKVGTQPWFILRQRIDDRALAGKKVAISAEIKLDLQEPAILHGWKVGGGLQISAKKRGVSRPLLRSTLEHEPHLGQTGWEQIQVIVDIPRRTEIIEVAFLHQADGSMQVRKPSLRLLDNASGATCEPDSVVAPKPAAAPESESPGLSLGRTKS